MADFYQFLADHNIEYERHDHPAVYTVEEAERLVPPLPGAKSKNLFLRDKKGVRHFLVVVPAQKRVNIKALPEVLGSSRLSFGSARRLEKLLGVQPGAVTLLAIFNDPDRKVEVFIDRALWESEAFHFHPLSVSRLTGPYARPLRDQLSFYHERPVFTISNTRTGY